VAKNECAEYQNISVTGERKYKKFLGKKLEKL